MTHDLPTTMYLFFYFVFTFIELFITIQTGLTVTYNDGPAL